MSADFINEQVQDEIMPLNCFSIASPTDSEYKNPIYNSGTDQFNHL